MTCISLFFFFNDTATTEIYTLSLHDALPICVYLRAGSGKWDVNGRTLGDYFPRPALVSAIQQPRSEEHTSELQSRQYLVCRLLLEKKKNLHTAHYVRARWIDNRCRLGRCTYS